MTMFGTILLIDDNSQDNFIHKCVIEDAKAASEVIEFVYAEDALKYLKQAGRPKIDVVFVDINMPRMNGWEFVEAFDELYPELTADTRIVMVSGSINPADRKKAEQNTSISAYLSKPLTKQALEHVYVLRNLPPSPTADTL